MKKLMLTAMAIFALAVTSANGALVGHYEFDNPTNIGESSAASADASHQLTAYGAAAYDAGGKFGGALNLDESFSYLRYSYESQVPSGFPLGDQSFTEAAFFKTTIPQGNAIYSLGEQGSGSNQYSSIITTSAGDLSHITNGGTYSQENVSTGSTDIYDGQWHHVAITYDNVAGETKLYLDGDLIGTKAMPGAFNIGSSNKNFVIGAYGKNRGKVEDHFFDGLIDDVRIYDEALDETAIDAIANPAEPALVAPDQITWLGQSVALEVTNPGGDPIWTYEPDDLGDPDLTITLLPNAVDSNLATLVVTDDDPNRMLPVTIYAHVDGNDLSVTIDVYDTACNAARLGLGDDRDGDRDGDCDADIADLLDLAELWLSADTSKLAGELGVLDVHANGGLNPVDDTVWEVGDTYRLAFATKYPHPGDNLATDIETYDARVTQAAGDAGIGGAWLCVAETQDDPDMYANIGQSGSTHAVLRVDSKVLWADLDAAGDMLATESLFNITEEGDLCPASQGYIAITGLGNTSNPTVNFGDCNRDSYWFFSVGGGVGTSSTDLHYYAISTPLTIGEYSLNADMADFADIAVDWDDNWVPATPQPRP